MKRIKKITSGIRFARICTITLLSIFTLSTCNVFLGKDPESTPQGIFDCVWNDFNETYALFEDRGIDWDQVYKDYTPIPPEISDYDLFMVCSNMLIALDDLHSRFLSPPFSVPLYWNSEQDGSDPFHPIVIKSYLENGGTETSDGMILWGMFKSEKSRHPVGYINITSFSGDTIGADGVSPWVKSIDDIVQSLIASTDALVIDVRNNPGGFALNMDYIASRFASVQKPYLKSCTRNGHGHNDFTPYTAREIKPAAIRYTKNIVLLTNKETCSSGEWFTMALRTQDHVTHVGQATKGIFSAKIIRPLINGWKYSMSVQKIRTPDGEIVEGIGIRPQIEVINQWAEIGKNQDKQLDKALALLNP